MLEKLTLMYWNDETNSWQNYRYERHFASDRLVTYTNDTEDQDDMALSGFIEYCEAISENSPFQFFTITSDLSPEISGIIHNGVSYASDSRVVDILKMEEKANQKASLLLVMTVIDAIADTLGVPKADLMIAVLTGLKNANAKFSAEVMLNSLKGL